MHQRTSRAAIVRRKKRNRQLRFVVACLSLLLILKVSMSISGQSEMVATKQPRPQEAAVHVEAQSQQPQLYNGCEVTSLSMLLQQVGKPVSKMELANQVRKDVTREVQDAQGNTISWGDPNQGFVGDVTGAGRGYGVYHAPIAALLNQYLPGRAQDLSGGSFDEVLNAIAEGKPVVVWTTVNFAPTSQWVTWKGPNGDVKATFDEHAVLLVGYTADSISVIDPLSGTMKKVNRATFQSSWEQMGSQAVTYRTS